MALHKATISRAISRDTNKAIPHRVTMHSNNALVMDMAQQVESALDFLRHLPAAAVSISASGYFEFGGMYWCYNR